MHCLRTSPPPPQEPFLFFDQLQISSAEKNTLEKYVEIMPPSFKISRHATAYQANLQGLIQFGVRQQLLCPVSVGFLHPRLLVLVSAS